MSKNVALFIDVANIYYAARGQDVDVDYIALLKHVTKGRDLIRAYAYSGLDPENENQRKFLDFLSKNGYKVVHKDIRKFNDGRVKANLDIELVVDLFRLQDRMDIAVIVSGDGDFASAMRALQDVGVRCEVISFRPNTSSDLIAVADEFTDIMKITGIGRSKSSRRMSMPEMPAKEVNPEFGFREASRGVAQAALAAIRDTGTGRTTRRRSGRAAAAESADAATQAAGEEPHPAVADHDRDAAAGEGSHHRRRRRGGRGRGRGRRSAEREASPETAEAGEPAWQEFDDVSELTDLGEPGEERAYSFAEADADTLAELGLSPTADGAASEGDGEAAAEKPAPRRRARSTRARKASDGTSGDETSTAVEPTADGGEETAAKKPAPRTRRSRSRKAAEPAAEAAAEAPAADADGEPAKPARRTRSRKKETTEAPAADADGETAKPARRTRSRKKETTETETSAENGSDGDEGIWQRFRSARNTTRRTS